MTLNRWLLRAAIWNAFQTIFLLLSDTSAKNECQLTADKLYSTGNQSNAVLFVILLPCEHKTPILTWPHIGPAILLGVHDAMKLLPPNMDIHIQYNDSKCSNSYSPWAAVQAQKNRTVHAFFGPVCDYAVNSVATLLKFLRVPLLTAGAHAGAFSMPKTKWSDDYYMLTKTGLSFLSVADLLINLGAHYKWKKYKLMYETQASQYNGMEKFCQLLLDTFAELLTKKGQTYSGYKLDKFNTSMEENLKREIGNEYGVIVICASPSMVRNILLTALALNMMEKGEYTFFDIELFASESIPWYVPGDSNNDRAKKAYEALLTITEQVPKGETYPTFMADVKRMAKEVFKSEDFNDTVSPFSTAFYQAVIIYTTVMKEVMDEVGNIDNAGEEISKRMRNRTFNSRIGSITLDENGDRYADYAVMDMDPETGEFSPTLLYSGVTSSLHSKRTIHWPGNRKDPPPDTPECGYDNAKCQEEEVLPIYVIALIVVFCVFIVLCILGMFLCRYYRRESALTAMTWKLNRGDLMMTTTKPMEPMLESSHSTIILAHGGIQTAFYKGQLVAVKELKPSRIDVTRKVMKDMKTLKDFNCDHLVRFHGACTEMPDPCLVTEYCTRGSLKGILENEEIKLDWMFRFSLITDIIKGMIYLHHSDIATHGSLSSENCVVDSRFVLKITNFGVVYLREIVTDQRFHKYWKRRLWIAPELLRKPVIPPEGTQKGDVYSFGIILHEIVFRQGPFNMLTTASTPRNVVNKVVQRRPVPFRPRFDEIDCREDVMEVMGNCWSEEPVERPDFKGIQNSLKRALSTAAGNLLDNLLKRMEQYADNLEALVEERTADYLEEKKKCERVLYELLPRPVANQLIMGQPVEAEAFDSVTIYFSDIVGFTAISARSTPMQVVVLLNALYTTFDSVIQSYDVYKVETIGDAYMVVSGLPVRNGNQHAKEIARMSLALLQEVKSFIIPHFPTEQIELRIGIHSGPCVAGVVGLKMPRYCLFGDTVNTASRMESTGEPLRIHISSATRDILVVFGIFLIELRGEIEAKGKGTMTTYWLNGERGSKTST